MAPVQKPAVSRELVEYLERLFPDRCPHLASKNRDVWASVGSVRVVKHLRQLYNEQSATVAETTE